MATSLLELQRQLTPSPLPANGAAPVAPARRVAPTARGGAELHVAVPGTVPAARERSAALRWHAAASMLLGWRAQRGGGTGGASRPFALPPHFADYLRRGIALPDHEKAGFLAACGLVAEEVGSREVPRWAAMLREYGPLWVTTRDWGASGGGSAILARVVTALHGGPSAPSARVETIDPASGSTTSASLDELLRTAQPRAGASPVEVIHLPRDAHMVVARSLAATRPSAVAALTGAADDYGDGEPAVPELAPRGVRNAREMSFAVAAAAPPPMTVADVHWAHDDVSPDYRHLHAGGVSALFAIDETTLARAAALNAFVIPAMQRRVVFALRGCRLHDASGANGKRLTAEEDVPNHYDNRCVIGVWNCDDHTVTAFEGSTVPNYKLMESYRQGGDKANLLPTGLFNFRVGVHRPTKEIVVNGETKVVDNEHKVLGALLQDESRVVLRSRDDLTFTVTDFWDHGWQGDNVHPARTSIHAPPSTAPDFSSAGCQTLPGDFTGGVPTGSWAAFRAALGFDNAHPSANDGKRVSYLLLTARDLRLAGDGVAALARLRFGSSGAQVEALQKALKKLPGNAALGTDGAMGAGTVSALIGWQQARDNGAADGILTPELGAALGVRLS